MIRGDFCGIQPKNSGIVATSPIKLRTSPIIPVIIIGNSQALTQNPIPETITEDIWRLCYTTSEIAKAIQFYQNRSLEKIKEHEKVGERIRRDYFEPVTREGVRKFLGL